jgi:A/G-specific adenine glycosylase
MTLAGTPVGRKRARVHGPPSTLPRAADLLAWYDRHRRSLPWRAARGAIADPYRVWLSEIMLQQTTVRAVAPYYARFLQRFPTVEDLARTDLADVLKLWAGLGYYARGRNLHACAKMVIERHGGCFPRSQAELAELPGVGPYTAAAIAAIAFDVRATPVDGNVERVVARVFACEQELPAAKPAVRQLAEQLTPNVRPGDFAQALMDLGATICTPKKPACALCPWNDACAAHARGDPERFPRKTAKAEGRLRCGAAFVAIRADGFVLARTRPARGLLGGMTEVPTTAWVHDFDQHSALADAPLTAAWRRVPGAVRHVFTHFPLELAVYKARVPASTRAPSGMRFIPLREVAGEAFPNVMRKVLANAGVDNVANAPARRARRARLPLT